MITTVRVISGTDWWLIAATFVGALAVLGAAVVAAIVSFGISDRQNKAQDAMMKRQEAGQTAMMERQVAEQAAITNRQNAARYRDGLNNARHETYPELIKWAKRARKAYDERAGLPTGEELPDYALLWCCASPPLWASLQELSTSWGNFAQPPTGEKSEQVPELITKLTHQARWDLFGEEGFFGEKGIHEEYWQNAKCAGDVVTYSK